MTLCIEVHMERLENTVAGPIDCKILSPAYWPFTVILRLRAPGGVKKVVSYAEGHRELETASFVVLAGQP